MSANGKWEAVIGLEVHCQVRTATKMFCGCANQYGDPPNTHVCPVCLGLPGSLPVPNEEAIRKTILTGFMLGCQIAPVEVRPEKLFLPGHAEELPDQPVR